MTVNNSEEHFHPDSLPAYDCLCELCDCGCFEQSRQPHTVSCKQLVNKTYEQRRVNSRSAIQKCQSVELKAPARGQLSEYQYQYLNSKNRNKDPISKIKDNIDIFSPDGKANDFSSQSANFEPRLRSKVLDRLNRLMPNNPNVSWYKAENSYFGHDDIHKTNTPNADAKRNYITMDDHKGDYLKTFEEYNRGFVDSYTERKGAELVSLSRTESEFERGMCNSVNKFNSNSGSVQSLREHDFRSPWIPKKYSGRNMFVSHIDSTLFPDKQCKENEVITHYNHFHGQNLEKKQHVLTAPSPYPKLDKSVRFNTATNDNRYVPTIITLPRKTPLYEEIFHEKPKPMTVDNTPTHSTYQGDYETPKQSNHNKNKVCKAAAVQALIRRDKFMADRFDKNKEHTLESVRQRQNEINSILMNS